MTTPKRVPCKFCGRILVYAWIPNRGPVMAHQRGDREACDRLRETGRDIVSNKARIAEAAARKAP